MKTPAKFKCRFCLPVLVGAVSVEWGELAVAEEGRRRQPGGLGVAAAGEGRPAAPEKGGRRRREWDLDREEEGRAVHKSPSD